MPAGQLLKSDGAEGYGCAADTTYSAGTGLQLSGTEFSIASGGVGGAQVADGSLSAADVNFSSSMIANGHPLNFVQSGRVGPVNGGFREYGFSVCNLTGSTATMPAATVRMLVIAQ